MTIPVQTDSVASLLEQILAVDKQILDALNATNMLLTKANTIAQETLDSSKRIEVLLGGGEEVSVPTMMKVVYKHVLSQKK
jgi:hypothetical protein